MTYIRFMLLSTLVLVLLKLTGLVSMPLFCAFAPLLFLVGHYVALVTYFTIESLYEAYKQGRL